MLEGLDCDSAPVEGVKNDPMMPVAWTERLRTRMGASMAAQARPGVYDDDGSVARFEQRSGSADAGECLLLVSGDGGQNSGESNVELVGEYQPSAFKTEGFRKGVKPTDLK